MPAEVVLALIFADFCNRWRFDIISFLVPPFPRSLGLLLLFMERKSLLEKGILGEGVSC